MAVTDNFNRADGGLGANWSTISGEGTGQVVSNQAETNSVGTDCVVRYSATTFGNDQYGQVKVVSSTTGSVGLGAMCRGSDSARTYYFAYGKVATGGTWFLKKRVAGTASDLTSGSVDVAANDVMYIEASGTSISLKKNGVTVLGPITDSAIASGWAGFIVFVDSGVVGDAVIDDWEGGDLSAGGRTAKNTRAFPLGMAIGMNWRMAGECS